MFFDRTQRSGGICSAPSPSQIFPKKAFGGIGCCFTPLFTPLTCNLHRRTMTQLTQIEAAKPSNFDEHKAPEMALIDDCVHCGFCLPACPTYVLWGEEMDSPRGRIYMMKKSAQGEAPLDQR